MLLRTFGVHLLWGPARTGVLTLPHGLGSPPTGSGGWVTCAGGTGLCQPQLTPYLPLRWEEGRQLAAPGTWGRTCWLGPQDVGPAPRPPPRSDQGSMKGACQPVAPAPYSHVPLRQRLWSPTELRGAGSARATAPGHVHCFRKCPLPSTPEGAHPALSNSFPEPSKRLFATRPGRGRPFLPSNLPSTLGSNIFKFPFLHKQENRCPARKQHLGSRLGPAGAGCCLMPKRTEK